MKNPQTIRARFIYVFISQKTKQNKTNKREITKIRVRAVIKLCSWYNSRPRWVRSGLILFRIVYPYR